MNRALSTVIQQSGFSYEFHEEDKRTVKELAGVAGVSATTIYRMRKVGLPFCGEYSTVQILRSWQVANPDWQSRWRKLAKTDQ